jgi:hypothetical protein
MLRAGHHAVLVVPLVAALWIALLVAELRAQRVTTKADRIACTW